MKVSLNWLRQYVDINVSIDEFCEKMVMIGFEVEEVIDLSATMHKVVVGKLVSVEKHPDADRLRICSVDIGDSLVQIVTGADNVFEGAHVPVALHGSRLPNGMKITKGKLRGVSSEGMLCSGGELCIGEEDFPGAGVDGILILDTSYNPGTDVRDVLGLNDIVIDFAITANRPDCQSVIGIAREAAVALGVEARLPLTSYTASGGNISDHIRVSVLDSDLCPRYYGSMVTNVRIEPSPDWMQKFLRVCGMRPINNIVDITNFVMLETGQPMHAFDMRDVYGGEIIVRRAGEGEKMVTLDNKEHTLSSDMLVISDAERPSCLAGIMGSKDSGIKADTSAIFLESAKFRRDSVRRTSRTLGIRTESSARFEKGVDIINVQYAMERALQLINELNAGDIVDGVIDCNNGLPEQRTLEVSARSVNALLGLDIPVTVMYEILTALNIETTVNGDAFTCIIPSYRDDIDGRADIAEEIIRIYGYNHIIGREINGPVTRGKKSMDRLANDAVKRRLMAQGFNEISTYSFITAKAADQLGLADDDERRRTVPVLNPISEEMAEMRTQLTTSMLTVLGTNHSRKVNSARFYEIGRQFLPKSIQLTQQPEERPALCIGMMGENEDFFTLKGAVEEIFAAFNVDPEYVRSSEPFLHPGRQASALINGQNAGTFGEVHPDTAGQFGLERVYTAEIRLDLLYMLSKSVVQVKPLPRYPAIERDLALLCSEELPVAEIEKTILVACGDILESIALFDVYQGNQIEVGKKSVAWRLVLRRAETTLTDTEAEATVALVVAALEKLGCTLRG